MGRVLGGIRLSGLRFFDGVLFFRKKSFYVFLSPNAVERKQFSGLPVEIIKGHAVFQPSVLKRT